MMNVLYRLRYRERFNDILALLPVPASKVVDLCFGDIYIASVCSKKGISWTGFDFNPAFVNFAIKKGYHAVLKDISMDIDFPKADVCIMSGSLYHFNNVLENLLDRMCRTAPVVIISEPVANLSSGKGLIAGLARRLTNAGKGNENFRYNERSIIEILDEMQARLQFRYRIVSIKRDILIEIHNDRNQCSNTGI